MNQFNSIKNGPSLGNFQSVFQKKTERINWKLLATVDIDKIFQQNDIRVLKENIKHVAFCDIESELDLRDSDRNLIKIFKLAQLMIDYLLSSQDYLVGALNNSEERSQVLMEETESAKRKLQENESFISELKRECHRRKKLILAQQQIMDSGPNAYHRCPYCEKAFLNASFLQAHLEKRHSDRYVKDWNIIDSPRKRSPKRDFSEEARQSHKDKNMEMLIQMMLERNRDHVSSPKHQKNENEIIKHMSDQFDQERNDWQRFMDQMQNKINDLEEERNRANQKNKKRRSHLRDLEDDGDNLTKEDIEKARQKAIESHKKKPIISQEENTPVPMQMKRPRQNVEELASHSSSNKIVDTLVKATNIEPISKSKECALYPNTLSVININELGDTSTVFESYQSKKKTNSNDYFLREYSECSIECFSSSNNTSQLFQSQSQFDESSTVELTDHCSSRSFSQTPHPSQRQLQTDKSNIQHQKPISPRHASSSPIHQKEDFVKLRKPQVRSSNLSLDDLSNYEIDFSPDLLEKFCDEVRHALDDHLELHGIKRGTTGISGAVLTDKINLMEHEHNQLKIKYVNYNEIRKKIETEVEKEAVNRVNENHGKSQQFRNSQENKNYEKDKHSSRSLQSSQNEWDDNSHSKQFTVVGKSNLIHANPRSSEKDHYNKAVEPKMRNPSPRSSLDFKNSFQASSDMSNTADSSAWQTESKAATSSVQPYNNQKK